MCGISVYVGMNGKSSRVPYLNHYIISISDILEINCSSIALLEECISQDTETLQGANDKI